MEPFIGQIMMFGGNFAPRGWALCDGQLLPIAQNSALFSILGTTYGGDGKTTFGLPDLRGRAPMHAGHGPGLSARQLGQKSGSETNTLTTNQIPSHKHGLNASNEPGSINTAAGNSLGSFGQSLPPSGPYTSSSPNTPMNAGAIGSTGGGQPVNNMQPFQVVNFVIALQGIFPSRS